MPQLNAAIRRNNTRVLDCLEYLFAYTLPTIGRCSVDRNRDPREVWQDKRQEYEDYAAQIRLKLADWKHQDGSGEGTKGTLSGVRRKLQMVEIIVAQTLTTAQDDAQIKIDQLTDWMRHDLEWVLEPDENGMGPIARAGIALNAMAGPWGAVGTWVGGGSGLPSCIDLHLKEGLAGSIVTFPDVYTVYELSYEYDEHGPGGIPGHSG